MHDRGANQDLQSLLEESIDSYGYELILMELVGRKKNLVLRLYIDAPGGITLDDCAFVSRQISRLLDVEDPIQGQYTLEVSSPGVERPLAKREHFNNAVGQNVEVETMIKCDGRRNFMGQLLKVENSGIVVNVSGHPYAIEMENIRRARLKPSSHETS